MSKYRWVDLAYHSKQFLGLLLVVNVMANLLLLMLAVGMIFALTHLTKSDIAGSGIVLYILFALVAVLLLYAVNNGLRGCARLAHYIK